jgi:hypothetical protein
MTMDARIKAVVLLAALVGGCAEEGADLESEGAVDELRSELELAGPGPGDMGPAGFLRCDSDPEVEIGTVCGRTVPVAAHFEWSECETERGTSSGTADVATASDDCAAGIEHQISFTDTHSLTFGDASATATGELVVALAASESARQATVDGEIAVSLPLGDAAIAITDLVRVPPSECQYPVAGTVAHTLPDGTSHILAFGPACGQATADGEPVDLATWRPPGPGPAF